MRTTYARIGIYRRLYSAVRASEHFVSRTQDLQISTLALERSIADLEKLLLQVQAVAVREYGSTVEKICTAYDVAKPLAEKAAQCLASACSDLPHLQDLLSSRGLENGEVMGTEIFFEVVENTKTLMQNDVLPIFEALCQKAMTIVDLGKADIEKIAEVTGRAQQALELADQSLCPCENMRLGPCLRSLAVGMSLAIRQGKEKQAVFRSLGGKVDALTRIVGTLTDAVGSEPISCSICFDDGRHAKCSECSTAVCGTCYGCLLQNKINEGSTAEWKKFSKYGCIKPQCKGKLDIRTSLSEDAGALFFRYATRCFWYRDAPDHKFLKQPPSQPSLRDKIEKNVFQLTSWQTCMLQYRI